jgi:hypothetical protein
MKLLGLTLLICFLLLINSVYGTENKNRKFTINIKQPSFELGPELQEADSYFESWIHYYVSKESIICRKQKSFYQNNQYFTQILPVIDLKRKDKFGTFHIPDKTSFFLTLTMNSLVIYSSRDDSMRFEMDALPYSQIQSIPEDDVKKGGIIDLGKSENGYCVEIKSIGNKNKIRSNWWICLNSIVEKSMLLKSLIKLKLKDQRKTSKLKTTETIKSENRSNTIANMLRVAKENKEKDSKNYNSGRVLDGYWIMLQDWSDCTLKCGGGESFQQWSCVPPKNNGNECIGESIRVRKCNTQPCPHASTILEMLKTNKKEANPQPIVKVAPFSSRRQRYDKCVLKENDAFLATKSDSEETPVRIIMNIQTITIFMDDVYQHSLNSYQLFSTTFKKIKKRDCCFEISDGDKHDIICAYPSECSDGKWVDKWAKDIILFKIQCNTGKAEVLLNQDDQNKLDQDLKKRINSSKADIVSQKQQTLKQEMLMNEVTGIQSKVTQDQTLSFQAVEKELQIENMVKEEENEREEYELQKIRKKIDEEKEKEECLHRIIKEKDMDNQIINEKNSVKQERDEIKKEVVEQIKNKRKQFKNMIQTMREKTNFKKNELEQELLSMRQKMAKEMLKVNSKGDLNNCRKGINDFDYREKYCDIHFVDDYLRNSDCKKEDFCNMCCEIEFGNNYIMSREKCYQMCDQKSIK